MISSSAWEQRNDPASWAAAPAPLAIQVLRRPRRGGADRIVITWPDGAIKNTYLQVIVAANADTGLAEADVFFFGNRVGESFSTQPPAVLRYECRRRTGCSQRHAQSRS